MNRPKLTGADKVKYQIYDEIAANLPKCATYADLEKRLRQAGITIQYKYRSGAEESPENIQGVSFAKGGITFKGSQIDRKFSHANLSKVLSANLNEAWEKMKDMIMPEVEPMKKEPGRQATAPVTPSPEPPHIPTFPVIYGVEITAEQDRTLNNGGHIWLQNMDREDGNGKFSEYLFMNDEKDRVLSCRRNPDEFVKYGKYEMRRRDKILVEKGLITRATVKWWGDGFARPYLWKENPGDTDYKESWYHPNTPKEQIEKDKQELENRFRRPLAPRRTPPAVNRTPPPPRTVPPKRNVSPPTKGPKVRR